MEDHKRLDKLIVKAFNKYESLYINLIDIGLTKREDKNVSEIYDLLSEAEDLSLKILNEIPG